MDELFVLYQPLRKSYIVNLNSSILHSPTGIKIEEYRMKSGEVWEVVPIIVLALNPQNI